MGPDVVGDPALAPARLGVVVAEHLDGELGIELGDGLGEVAQVAPGAALRLAEGAGGDVALAPADGALGVEAPGEDAEELGIMALLGELVDALEPPQRPKRRGALWASWRRTARLALVLRS
jgi:hypothetical protein